MKNERVKYPDGQISATNVESGNGRLVQRINSYEDLFFVRSIAEALDHQNIQTSLFIPCMFGQRSDRRFSRTQSFDLKVIAEVINNCNFKSVEVFDPHSDITLALLNRSVKMSSFRFVEDAISHMKTVEYLNPKDIILVSPDAGAYKKVFDYALELKLPVTAAVKHRDLDGTVALNFIGDVKDKHCLIVDDLCDGGYTFIQLGKFLKEQGAKSISLYISHAYFSKGFTELTAYIDHIYCTNSVKDLEPTVDIDGGLKAYNYITQFKLL